MLKCQARLAAVSASLLALAAVLSGCADGTGLRGSEVAGSVDVVRRLGESETPSTSLGLTLTGETNASDPSAAQTSDNASLYSFYVYRSQSNASYPPKNVNAANLEGVVWYLQHEVMVQTPPKFGVTRILRYRVETRAPEALLARGMNFGVRYAYDSQNCTGPGDCSPLYAKYGYFVGCNKFESMYPYPNEEAYFPGGIWYSFPGEGACEGEPTGEANCTYSYSWPPEEISLEDLEGSNSSEFWRDGNSTEANAVKVEAAAEAFRRKYPASENLTAPDCDFDFGRFWS